MAVSVDHVKTWDTINEDVKNLLIEDFKSSENIVKLFYLISSQKQKVDEAIIYLAKFRLINTATGAYLDILGQEMGVDRNGLDDEEYRTLLKIRAYRVASSGTRGDIIDIFARFTGTQPDDLNTYVGMRKTFDVFFVNLCLESEQAIQELIKIFPIISRYRLGSKIGDSFGFSSLYAQHPPHGIGGLGSLYINSGPVEAGKMASWLAHVE